MQNNDINHIFEKITENFPSGISNNFDSIIRFSLAGEGGGEWTLSFHDGRCITNQGFSEDADAVLETSVEEFINLLADPEEQIGWAFLQGRFNMTGNIMQLWRVLASLRKSYNSN